MVKPSTTSYGDIMMMHDATLQQICVLAQQICVLAEQQHMFVLHNILDYYPDVRYICVHLSI